MTKGGGTPTHADDFRKKEKPFREWLCSQGAEILAPTNPWELLRFTSYGATSVLYRNAAGVLSWTGESGVAWKCWRTGAPWVAVDKTNRRSGSKKTSPVIRTLLDRDGDGCFYCQREMNTSDITIEHLVSRAHGGPNHISNYVLAHTACNKDAGHLSVMEKILLREKRKDTPGG